MKRKLKTPKAKKALGGTTVKGIRLPDKLWDDLEEAAGNAKRNLNNYIFIALDSVIREIKKPQ